MQGVEDSIISLFDRLSYQHAYDDELKHNIHYYDGWKTNSAYKINKRVILPLNAYDYGYLPYGSTALLSDIERVFNYLDNGETTEVDMQERLDEARKNYQTRNIELKYFRATFYKKGTCHITFTNERLLKKFNIFGSQKKGWLPKGYAKRSYQSMTPEEQAVIESFEGESSYMESYANAQYYLFDVAKSMPMLGGGEDVNVQSEAN
ncbi:MAG: DUF4942 domain-containing protein [Synergistaceae bacterium]|nr:DUF4942 domain-containing protein [Synergistaceae bacterium]